MIHNLVSEISCLQTMIQAVITHRHTKGQTDMPST